MNDDERSNEFRACCLRTPFPLPPSLPYFTRIISIIETELASVSPERRNQTCCPATRQASQRDIKRKKKKKEKSARPTQFKPQPNAKSPVTRRSKRFQAVLSLPSFSRLRFQKRAALPLPCFSFPRRTLTREETTENPFLSSSSSSSEKRGGN